MENFFLFLLTGFFIYKRIVFFTVKRTDKIESNNVKKEQLSYVHKILYFCKNIFFKKNDKSYPFLSLSYPL